MPLGSLARLAAFSSPKLRNKACSAAFAPSTSVAEHVDDGALQLSVIVALVAGLGGIFRQKLASSRDRRNLLLFVSDVSLLQLGPEDSDRAHLEQAIEVSYSKLRE